MGVKRILKWILAVAVVGGVVAGSWWYWRKTHETVTQYQTAVVTRGGLTQAVTATGQLGPVLNVQVGSQISGIVKKLYADFNSVVKSNQVIAEIDPSTYQLTVLRAQAQLANSKANLTLAEVQARRAETLYTNKLISASDHDTAIASLQQAEAMVLSDEVGLTNAQVQLSYCTIYAPVDGVVITRSVDVGQTVAASFSAPTIFVIANDLSKMEIDALVSEADIGGVLTGQDVNFTVDAFPYRTFRGRVNRIRYGAITNQNVINYDCVISVDNSDLKLLPSMTANVSIVIAERENVVKIPNAALRYRPPEAAVPGSETNGNAARVAMAAMPGPGAGANIARGGDGAPGGPGRGRGGEGRRGGGRGGDTANRGASDRPLTRTVYVMPKETATAAEASDVKPKPVSIKVGISDGVMTEVVDGLNEGDLVVIGMLTSGGSTSTAPASNPFGGGFRGRF